MKVIDHAPHSWFLLEDEGRLYLDTNCTHSFVGYSVLIELDGHEKQELRERGRDYLHRLSQDINDSAPILQASRSPYKSRDLTQARGREVTEAVTAWKARTSG